jgi:exopolyphosphatase/guanosine-5'-triphosphate,3'-diphosphate pyrophosphatase
MLYGLVDLGANSVRLSVYRVEGAQVVPLISKKETAGLSAYVQDGALSRAGMARACQVLAEFRAILENFGIGEMHVFATASLRNITNTEEAVARIARSTGIAVDVLSGADEARLDYAGASRGAGIRDGILVDIGGGSTELTEFSRGTVISAASMPVGSLNMYVKNAQNGLIPGKVSARAIRTDVCAELDKLTFVCGEYPRIYGVGGTIRATAKLANALFDLSDDNREISFGNLKDILRLFRESKRIALESILRVAPERVHTLVPGMTILKTVMKRFSGDVILVSGYGVREGYLYERVLGGKVDAAGDA